MSCREHGDCFRSQGCLGDGEDLKMSQLGIRGLSMRFDHGFLGMTCQTLDTTLHWYSRDDLEQRA